MIKNFSEIYNSVSKRKKKKRVVVAAANDTHVLKAVMAVRDKNIIEPILVGDEKMIKEIAEKNEMDISKEQIINEENPNNAAIESVKIIREGKGDILVKGFLETSSFLKPILNKETGLRRGGVFSSICITEIENYYKIFGMIDPAINIAPNIDTKIDMLKNSIYFMRKLGIDKPKVAVIASYSLVNLKMQATIDAAILSKMAERDQIRNCYIEGPLSFGDAISKKSAEEDGLTDEVSGNADILLLPNLEAANSLYKSMIHFANATTAGIILGASVPIVVTSRTDPEDIKINSIVTASSVDFD